MKCTNCGADIINVRDEYTGATFAVDAEPARFKGFDLSPPGERERNQRAAYTEIQLYRPHNPCPQETQTDLDEEGEPDE